MDDPIAWPIHVDKYCKNITESNRIRTESQQERNKVHGLIHSAIFLIPILKDCFSAYLTVGRFSFTAKVTRIIPIKRHRHYCPYVQCLTRFDQSGFVWRPIVRVRFYVDTTASIIMIGCNFPGRHSFCLLIKKCGDKYIAINVADTIVYSFVPRVS